MTALSIRSLVFPLAVLGVLIGIAFAARDVGDSFALLGITSATCSHCSYTVPAESGEAFWSFESEPVITGVDPDGPAGGKLRRKDKIAAIDGMPITTHGAGKRLANIAPGEAVELHVRRRGRLIEETIVTRELELNEGSEVEGLGGPLSHIDLELLASAVSLFGSEEDSAKLVDGLAELLELPAEDLMTQTSSRRDSGPLGWFGVGLSFAGSVVGMFTDDSRWQFEDPPRVVSVVRDGPADRAGLQRGDRLTHIDGIRLDSGEGGRRFSDVRPGDRVTWTVERGNRTLDVDVTAESPPEPRR